MFFFFFNDTATTEIYTLSLHDALPISSLRPVASMVRTTRPGAKRAASRAQFDTTLVGATTSTGAVSSPAPFARHTRDRKSTRLNSSHANISYAVFCLKKKNNSSDDVLC